MVVLEGAVLPRVCRKLTCEASLRQRRIPYAGETVIKIGEDVESALQEISASARDLSIREETR